MITASGNPTFTQKYTYDAVNRIKTVGENNDLWQRTYSYDAFGNRAATGSGITMGSPTPTAVTQFDAATNRIIKLPTGADLDPDPMVTTDDPYDAAGNMVRHPIVGSMAYDANNKQRFYCAGHVTCTSGNAVAEYRYDGAGNRVEKLTSAETTSFVYDVVGKLAAEYSTTAPANSGLFFRTLDHLGSTRLVTDAADPPNVVSRRDFLPFGEHIPADATFNRQALAGYNAGSAFTQQFTAKERDAESGLDYFLARYFSASLGRFTGPDGPLVDQFVVDPQSWNLYAYTRNNPLKYVDPTGQAIQLLGDTEADRDAELEAIKQSLVNSKVAKNLTSTGNEKDGFFVGVVGKVRDFQKAGSLETDLGILIAKDEVVEFTLDDATSTKSEGVLDFLFGKHNFDVGNDFGGGVTHRSDASTSGNIQSVVDPNGIMHRTPGVPVQTLGEAVAHELLGHAVGFTIRPRARGATTNKRANDAENEARRRGGPQRGIRRTHPGGFPTK